MANGYYNKKGLIDPDKLQREFASKQEHLGWGQSRKTFDKNEKIIKRFLETGPQGQWKGEHGQMRVGSGKSGNIDWRQVAKKFFPDFLSPYKPFKHGGLSKYVSPMMNLEFGGHENTKPIEGAEGLLETYAKRLMHSGKMQWSNGWGNIITSQSTYKNLLNEYLQQYHKLATDQVMSEQRKTMLQAQENILKQQGIYEQVHKQTFQDFQSKRYGQSIQDFISGIKGEQERKIFLQRQQNLISAQRQHEYEQEQLGLQEREAELKSQTLIGGRGLGGSSIESDTQAQVKSQSAEQKAQSQQRFANEFVRAESQAQQDLLGLSGTLSREKQMQTKSRQEAQMHYEQSINLIVQENMKSEMQRVQMEFQKQRTNLTDEINEISAKLNAFTI